MWTAGGRFEPAILCSIGKSRKGQNHHESYFAYFVNKSGSSLRSLFCISKIAFLIKWQHAATQKSKKDVFQICHLAENNSPLFRSFFLVFDKEEPPGLVVVGGDYSEGCGFKSAHRKLARYFLKFICCKNWKMSIFL